MQSIEEKFIKVIETLKKNQTELFKAKEMANQTKTTLWGIINRNYIEKQILGIEVKWRQNKNRQTYGKFKEHEWCY